MRIKKIIPLLMAATMTVLVCGCAEEAPSNPVNPPAEDEKFDLEYSVVLTDTTAGFEVSPFIYGEFLEHIPGCIYGAIWAELIEDRKFFYPVGEDGLSPWSVSGAVADGGEGYSLNGYCALLGEDGEISQSVFLSDKKYVGYFYAEGDGTVEVCAGETRQSIPVAGGFKKYVFDVDVAQAGVCKVAFGCAEGEVRLDSLSLMPADNYMGMRRDTLNSMKELAGTIYRWPGGNFVSGYNWKDGVGDRDRRVCMRNPAWFPDTGDIESDKEKLNGGMGFYSYIEPNDMGTDEFLAMCEYIGATPYLAVNTGTGTTVDAVDYVNYCNGSVSTEYGALRAENGRAQPYGVKYWCVGNEMQGDWQIGHTTIDRYVKIHNAFTDAMRGADPSIAVTGCGDNFSDWTEGMFASCASRLDYIGEHLYSERDEDFTANVMISSAVNNFQYRIDKHRKLIEKYPAASHVKIAFDEYAYAWNGQPDIKDAMGIASVLNLFIANADVVGMANYSDAVFTDNKNNAPGAIYAYRDRTEFSTIGYVLQAYAGYMQGYACSASIRQTDRTTNLQYQATVSADGKTLSLAVVNPSAKTIKLAVSNRKYNVETHVSVTGTGEKAENGLAEKAERTVVASPKSMIAAPSSVNVFVINIG